jgi:hypothetical protein
MRVRNRMCVVSSAGLVRLVSPAAERHCDEFDGIPIREASVDTCAGYGERFIGIKASDKRDLTIILTDDVNLTNVAPWRLTRYLHSRRSGCLQ